MQYDFTSIMDRRGRDALAVDGLGTGFAPPLPKDGVEPIPMWVADMNFPTVPTIVEAIVKRAQHPAFGYFQPTEDYYNAIIQWQSRRNGVTGLTREAIGYENGVLGGVISALNVLCSKGDTVLLHSPTYIGFTGCLLNNGYHIVHSPLVQDEAGVWRMDFADMEEKLVQHKIHAAIFCSPHNPTGRVWERWELEQAMALFQKHDVFVVSDEIWSDIILEGYKHIPTQSVSEDARNRTVALYAPSKTFNLAGLVGSYHIIYNQWMRERVEKEASLCHYNDMNVLSMHALLGAYKPEGYVWVDELRQVLTGNIEFACDYIAAHFPGVQVSKPQGTYMLFLDCTQWCAAHGKTIEEVLKAGWDAGVMWQDGRMFHGPCHIRMNLALPLSRVQEALRGCNNLSSVKTVSRETIDNRSDVLYMLFLSHFIDEMLEEWHKGYGSLSLKYQIIMVSSCVSILDCDAGAFFYVAHRFSEKTFHCAADLRLKNSKNVSRETFYAGSTQTSQSVHGRFTDLCYTGSSSTKEWKVDEA